MDLEEVKACLRGLLSSTAFSYNLNSLLNDFKNMTGSDLPLFGHLHPIEFLRTLNDTVQLFGNHYNPEVALVNSKKSAHITSLVDRQKNTAVKSFRCLSRQKRLIVPERDFEEKENKFLVAQPSYINKETMAVQTALGVTPYIPNQSLPKTAFSIAQPQHSFGVSIPDQILKAKDLPSPSSFCDGKASSMPAYKVQGEKSIEAGNNYSSYLEDISDSESCLSMEDFRSNNAASSSCFVNDSIKNKLKKLIRDFPEGLWCCDLPKFFKKEYNFELDFREYGYTSLIQMLSELPDVFRCVRPGNDDWVLFDASVAPSSEERKMMDLQAAGDINCEIAPNLRKLLFNVFENRSNSRVDLDWISEQYKKIYNACLDFHSLGFRDLKSFLKTWEGNLFSMVDCDGKTYLVPALKNSAQSIRWEEALPPITAENDIFIEIFPKEVVGPEENLLELDLARHVAVGNVINVTIAEVWSPSLFYMQLNKFKNRLTVFMDELQKFYNVHLKRYKMPDSTIRPKQICVGLYTPDPDTPDEWHRAQIVKVINEKMVLVNFVDYGTEARVKKTHLRFLHRSFQSFPVQGLLTQLSGIEPADSKDNWPISTSKRFLELVQVSSLNAEIIDIDFKKPRMSVILRDPSHKSEPSINKKLVLENLAIWRKPTSCNPLKEEPETLTEDRTAPQTSQGTLEPTGGSVQEKCNNNNLFELTDEFSDIADLGHPTLFHFKMKLEDSLLPNKSGNEQINSVENLKYEFDEVPDLDIKVETEKENAPAEETKSSTSIPPQPSIDLPKPSTAPLTESKNPNPLPVSQQQLEFPQLHMPDECNLVPFPGKPKRLPPGLEHGNPSVGFEQLQLISRPDALKKRINILAMQFLTTNSSIKQVGMNDPALAVKIATEMAEACITSKYSPDPSVGFDSLLLSALQLWNTTELKSCSEEVSEVANPPSGTSDCVSSQHQSESAPRKSEKEQTHVKEIQVDGKTLHLVTIDHELYFCAEQIVRSFTSLSGREVADRILQVKKIHTDYRIVTKATDEKVLNVIKRCSKSSHLPVIKRKSKKLKIYLIPIRKVIPVLQDLGCNAKHLESYFQELQCLERKQETPEKKENSEVS